MSQASYLVDWIETKDAYVVTIVVKHSSINKVNTPNCTLQFTLINISNLQTTNFSWFQMSMQACEPLGLKGTYRVTRLNIPMKFINNLWQDRQIHLHVWNRLKQLNNIKKVYNEKTEDTNYYVCLYDWEIFLATFLGKMLWLLNHN